MYFVAYKVRIVVLTTQPIGGNNWIPVEQPARLGALLQEFLEPHQLHTHVAETLGLSRSRYSRLRRGLETKSITARTHQRICDALWPKMPALRRHELESCFLSAEDKARGRKHRDWLARQLRPYHPGWGRMPFSGIWGMPELTFIWRKDRKPGRRFKALDTLMKDLEKHGPPNRPGNPTYIQIVARFVEWCLREPYPNLRILLGVVRVLGPFVDAIETGERQETGWRTLHERRKLEGYLERGFAAQKLLIRKP